MTKAGLYAIDKSTTLESNKSLGVMGKAPRLSYVSRSARSISSAYGSPSRT
jgi:hypothetical protein